MVKSTATKKRGNPITAIARIKHVRRAPKTGRGLLILANVDIALLKKQAEAVGLMTAEPVCEFPRLTSSHFTVTPAQRVDLLGVWNFLHAALDKLEVR